MSSLFIDLLDEAMGGWREVGDGMYGLMCVYRGMDRDGATRFTSLVLRSYAVLEIFFQA
jgi:hypothetical protein